MFGYIVNVKVRKLFLVEISLAVLEKKSKMWKVYRRTDRWTPVKALMSFQLS